MFHPLPLYIGLRYTRAKRRNHFISFISMVSMLGVALGITVLITVLSVMNGFQEEVRVRILGMASHATVTGFSGGLADWEGVAARVGDLVDVAGAAPYVEGQAMLANGREVSGAIVRGILPEAEPAVSDVEDHMVSGSTLDLRPGEYGIVLGIELARVLGVVTGDKVVVVTPQTTVTPAGILPKLRRFTVKGIFEVGMGEFDSGVALIHIEDAARLFRMGDEVSGLRLKLDDMFDAPFIARDLMRALGGRFLVRDWTQQYENYFRAVRTEKTMMFIILLLIVGVAAFNIVSTLVMLVTDKQADIAILRTLGVTPAKVMAIFVVQGFVIGAVGTLLGVIGGVALALNVETIVPLIEGMMGQKFLPPDVYYISELPSDLQWGDVLRISLAAFSLTLVATLYPAWRASRTQPAEALRYE
ncbi:MAG: lipoprotein-releasing ABC transporter permease subunit [Gammaproteobacteria bacterium]|jgi:lipoprotein-releasing system permease protein|nr:lipoprotein-releasing ABC transporter permease subunit [Gammaproteobacteria bacterium]